jgi:hypothetical protein
MIEILAERIHVLWMDWAQHVMETEKLSHGRTERWKSCIVPYADLSEEIKELDRQIARDFIEIMKKEQLR